VFYAAAALKHDVPGWAATESARGSGGVQKSIDHCLSWTSISNGLPSDTFACVAMEMDLKSDPQKRTLYASMFGDGVYKTTDGGANWLRASEGLGGAENRHVYALYLHPNGTLYCLITGKHTNLDFVKGAGLYKSTDGAKTWSCITESLTVYWPTEFHVDEENPNVIWLSGADVPKYSTGGLYKTVDGGKTWNVILTNKDFDQKMSAYVHCFALTQHPTRKSVLYLSTWTHGLQISEDAGKTWRAFKGIPFTKPNRVSFDPENPDTIYVTTYGGGVWKGPWKGY
jgi:hypothetical protein